MQEVGRQYAKNHEDTCLAVRAEYKGAEIYGWFKLSSDGTGAEELIAAEEPHHTECTCSKCYMETLAIRCAFLEEAEEEMRSQIRCLKEDRKTIFERLREHEDLRILQSLAHAKEDPAPDCIHEWAVTRHWQCKLCGKQQSGATLYLTAEPAPAAPGDKWERRWNELKDWYMTSGEGQFFSATLRKMHDLEAE